MEAILAVFETQGHVAVDWWRRFAKGCRRTRTTEPIFRALEVWDERHDAPRRALGRAR